MKLRVARHTTDLQKITNFYCLIPGIRVLGGFTDHDGYDGVFLGVPDLDWHLEFTTSATAPKHSPDDDDLLVFYLKEEEYQLALKELKNNKIAEVDPVNPYWRFNGATFVDPDGFRLVLTCDN